MKRICMVICLVGLLAVSMIVSGCGGDDDACEGLVCVDNAACNDLTGECECLDGFSRVGDSCIPVGPDACADVECADNASCNQDTGECECDEGFIEDEDECIREAVNNCEDVDCVENASCDEATGECVCDDGYVEEEGACVEDSTGPCADIDCAENASCDPETGVCTCDDGYMEEGDSCVPIMDDLCENVDCADPGICAESVACNPETGLCEVTWKPAGAACDDGLACNGSETCDGSGACLPGEAVACDGNLSCTEPEATCECVAPFHMENGVCTGPTVLATMEDLGLGADSTWNGSDESGGFLSGVAWFANVYDTEFGAWEGFAASTTTDTETTGWDNQFSAITGGGVANSYTYAVAYRGYGMDPPTVSFSDSGADGYAIAGVWVTNTTYTYLSMRDGDDFAKKFGGETGNDPDYLKMMFTGIDADGNTTGPVEFYLADYRFEDNGQDYIVNDWQWVDLSSLGAIVGFQIDWDSTDVGDWGINTPLYAALDNLTRAVDGSSFEDITLGESGFYNGSDSAGGFVSGGANFANGFDTEFGSWSGWAVSSVADNETAGWDNQYSAIPGSGVGDSLQYGVGYAGGFGQAPVITPVNAGAGQTISGLYVTNTTYAYLSMRDGDDFAKKFGGADGTEPDWFLLTITGYDAEGAAAGTVEYYLADFRSENSADDYLVSDWTWVDLTSLGNVASLGFELSSSDIGDWGMNTPAFFAIDNFDRSLER